MKMTIKQIAEMAGVSRGTVDRVLHNRYGVDPTVKKKVKKILKEIEYQPNVVAKALKMSGRDLHFAYIILDTSNPFWDIVVNGFYEAQKSLEPFGVRITRVNMKEIDPQEQVRCIEQLLHGDDEINGLMLPGIDSLDVNRYIAQIKNKIPIITYNTDINAENRLCFVGQNHLQAGQVAGRLMALLLRKDGEIASFVGMKKTRAHIERLAGLKNFLSVERPNCVVREIIHREADDVAYEKAKKVLQNAALSAIYVTGEGSVGVAKALKESGRRPEVKMICYDMIKGIVDAVKDDIIDITIGQQEYIQGYIAAKIMYDYVALGIAPQSNCVYTATDIRVKENVEFNEFSIGKDFDFLFALNHE